MKSQSIILTAFAVIVGCGLLALIFPKALSLARADRLNDATTVNRASLYQGLPGMLRFYKALEGEYPKSLDALVTWEKMNFPSGPPQVSKMLFDSWGMSLQYTNDGESFTVTSAGADRKFETQDDIVMK